MPDSDNDSEMISCGGCKESLDWELCVVDVDIVMQGKIPLFVISYRCPLCRHEWTEALEPQNRPDLPNDKLESQKEDDQLNKS